MRCTHVSAVWCLMLLLSATASLAARPEEKRENATYIVTGKVQVVYMAGTEEHANYIIEIKVDEVAKGDRLKKGDTFRAACYQNKTTSIGWDTRGHTIIPKAGQRVKVYVNDNRGRNDGVYPDWVDVLEDVKK